MFHSGRVRQWSRSHQILASTVNRCGIYIRFGLRCSVGRMKRIHYERWIARGEENLLYTVSTRCQQDFCQLFLKKLSTAVR